MLLDWLNTTRARARAHTHGTCYVVALLSVGTRARLRLAAIRAGVWLALVPNLKTMHTQLTKKGLNLSRADARLSDQLRRSTQIETESPVTFLLPSLPMPSYHFCIATETRSPSILMVFQAPQ